MYQTQTLYLVFNFSRKKGGQAKETTNDNKGWTEIIIANAKNEITSIMYQNKTELVGKKLPVRFPHKKIDELAKKTTNQLITK